MNKLIQFALLFSIAFIPKMLFAQKGSGNIGVGIGFSGPVGGFAETKPGYNEAGFANGGVVFDLNFNYLFSKNFGISAMIRRQNNSVDIDALTNSVIRSSGYPYWTTTSDPWSSSTFMFGLIIGAPMGERLSLQTRYMVGLMSAKSPATIFQSGSGYWIEQSSDNGTSFAFLIGGSLLYKLTKHFGLSVNLDFQSGKPSFAAAQSYFDSSKSTAIFDQHISTINFTGGVSYIFN